MNPPKNKPIKVPDALLPATRDLWTVVRSNAARMDRLVAEMEAIKAENTNAFRVYSEKLVQGGVLAVGQEYDLDTRYLDALGFAYVFVEDKPDPKLRLN